MNNWGEILDRFTINCIRKQKKENKSLNVSIVLLLIERLASVNQKLWMLEDEIRSDIPLKQAGIIGKEIATTNDERAKLKNEINEFVGSNYKEEKIYNNNTGTSE